MKAIIFCTVFAVLASLCIAQTLVSPLPRKNRICTSSGDPHFVRFDGVSYDFQGTGDYVLAYFSYGGYYTIVQARQYACGTGVSCNSGVAVSVGGIYIQILGDVFRVNGGAPLSLIIGNVYTFGPIQVVKSGFSSYTLNVPGGTILWQSHFISITVIPQAVIHPFGLCVLVARCPKLYSIRGVIAPLTNRQIAEQWLVADTAESLFTYTREEPFEVINKINPDQKYGPFQTTDPAINRVVEDACAELATGDLVQKYGRLLDPKPFWQACADDVIVTGGKRDFAAPVIQAYRVQAENIVDEVTTAA
jgi:hypothetical protein